MRHGSLFSGIGGFDLAAERMGWSNIFHVENDKFCRSILRHQFPNSTQHEDIKTFDAAQYLGRIDIITGGFPCQPFSSAGSRRGVSDNRYLWPEMFRVIREIRPTYVVAENVRGLTSWNEGAVLDACCTDLENEGYEVAPVLLGACAVNAPHERQRIWIVAAHTNGKECQRWRGASERQRETSEQRGHRVQRTTARPGEVRDASHTDQVRLEQRQDTGKVGGRQSEIQSQGGEPSMRPETGGHSGPATNAVSNGMEGCLSTDINKPKQEPEKFAQEHLRQDRHSVPFEEFPTVSPIRGADDGVSLELDGITFSKWRKESIKAYGNAIVPQVAQILFQVIQDIDDELNDTIS